MSANESTKPSANATAPVAATKAVAKKTVSKPVSTKVATKTAVPKVAPKAVAKPAALPKVKPEKVKKPKMIRDSFTMPKAEFAVIEVLKARAANLKKPAKKTELIRAGIKALAAMSDAAFTAAVAAVPNLKTGRPAKS